MFKEGPQLKGCVTPNLEAIHTSPGHVPELLLSLGLQKARWRLPEVPSNLPDSM